MTVKIEIDIDTEAGQKSAKALQSAIDSLNKSVEETSDTQKKAETSSTQFSGSMTELATKGVLVNEAFQLVKSAISFVASSFSDAVKDAIEFSAALTDVKTIAPTTDLKALSDQLLSLSANWGVDKISAARAQYDIMSSGITEASDAFKVLEGATKLAVATGAEVSETAPTITAAINAWGLSASDVGQVMDSLAITTQDGVVRMTELGPVFGQIAATAAAGGVSLQELNAAIAALTLGGAPASVAGTQLKAVVASLLKPTEELSKAFQKQAGSSTAAFLKANGLAATLEQLKTITRGNAEEMSRLFGPQEAVAGLLPLLTGQSDNFTKSLAKQNAAISQNGKATEKMAKIVEQSAAFQLKKLDTTISALSVQMVRQLEPAIASGASGLTSFVQSISDFGKENQDTFDAVGNAITGFIEATKGFLEGVTNSDTFKHAVLVLKEVVTTSFQALSESFDRVKNFAIEAFNEMTQGPIDTTAATKTFGDIMQAAIKGIILALEGSIYSLIDFVKNVKESFDTVVGFGKGVINVFDTVASTIAGFVSGFIEKIIKLSRAVNEFTGLEITSERQFANMEYMLGMTNAVKDAFSLAGAESVALADKQEKLSKVNKKVAEDARIAALIKKEEGEIAQQSSDKVVKAEENKQEAVKKTIKLTAEQKKKLEELRELEEDNEANQYANKTDRLIDFERNFNAYSKGIGEIARQAAKDIEKMEEEEAKHQAKIADEYRKSVKELDDIQKKMVDDQEKRQKEAAEKIKEFWEGVVSTVQSSVSLVLSAGKSFQDALNPKLVTPKLEEVKADVNYDNTVKEAAIAQQKIDDKRNEQAKESINKEFEERINAAEKIAKKLKGDQKERYDEYIDNLKEERDRRLDAIDEAAKREKQVREERIEAEDRRIEQLKKADKEKEIQEKNRAAIAEAAAANEKAQLEAKQKLLETAASTVSSIGKAVSAIDPVTGQIIQLASIVFQLPEILKMIPLVIEGLVLAIPAVIDALIEETPKIITSLIDKLPNLIQAIIRKLPDIAKFMVTSLANPVLMTQLAVAVFDALVRIDWFDLGVKMARSMWDGLRELVDDIGGFFKDLGKKIWDGLKEIFDLSNLLPSWAGGSGSSGGGGILNSIAGGIMMGPVGAIGGLLSGFGLTNNQRTPWGEAPEIAQIPSIASGSDYSQLSSVVGSGNRDVPMSQYSASKEAIDRLPVVPSDYFSNAALERAVQFIKENLPGTTPAKFDDQFFDVVRRASEIRMQFANGGLVPGDSARNDIVPAMLSPGELVIPRSAMSRGMAGVTSFAGRALGMASGGVVPSGATISPAGGVLEELQALRAEVHALRYESAKVSNQELRIMQQWDSEGIPATRV